MRNQPEFETHKRKDLKTKHTKEAVEHNFQRSLVVNHLDDLLPKKANPVTSTNAIEAGLYHWKCIKFYTLFLTRSCDKKIDLWGKKQLMCKKKWFFFGET